ncbi:MAG TPA: universal stress protein [Woeseiaceae bacterium]|nr:universal stress protein [Woeseiaceae bacterium]
MTKRSPILAVVEPDISPREVVERAASIAELTDAPLELLLCDADVGALGDTIYVSNEARDIAAQIRSAQEEQIDELARPARSRDIEVKTSVLDKRPVAEGIVHVALDRNPLYVVKGTQYHSDAERAILLDTDWQLIRHCPFPLWLVKPRPLADKPVIMAAVDPMHSDDEPGRLDDAIIEHAKAIAGPSRAELQLFHAYQPMSGVGAAARLNFKPDKLSVDEISEKMEKEHRARLDALAANHGIDPAHTHQLPGSARDLLPYVARDWKADLVVMGALARGGGGSDHIGRTAERVLDHLPCDVVIVRL